ncbi:MAG: DegT/DnrJ/EryC1/StrS family aminotransferase [Chloroflexota bacterium]|nr:DegT/DnrJ/EryC1/StrS family aminotransferase [Chloroflexota bacterium]
MIPQKRPHLNFFDILSVLSLKNAHHKFEQAVANHANARYGVAFAYAHSGFLALLKVLNLSQTEIILPAYTCDIMAETIVVTGNVPVFVDINLNDYNMDLDELKTAISPKTSAIIATHLFGYPIDVDAVRHLSGDERILIVEDAALTFPGSRKLRGDVGMFSFGSGKPLFTVRGGVIVTNDAKIYEQLKAYRDQQMNKISPTQLGKRLVRLIITYLSSKNFFYQLSHRLNSDQSSYDRPTTQLPIDYNSGYANFQAQLGLAQLRRSPHFLSRRRQIAECYDNLLQGIAGLTLAPLIEEASYSHYTIRVKKRDHIKFSQKMRMKNIETGRTFDYALPTLKKYKSYVHKPFPCAEQAGQEVVNLPLYTGLSQKQIHYIADSIGQILQENNEVDSKSIQPAGGLL